MNPCSRDSCSTCLGSSVCTGALCEWSDSSGTCNLPCSEVGCFACESEQRCNETQCYWAGETSPGFHCLNPEPESVPEPEPGPQPWQPPDDACYDHYSNCADIVAEYSCVVNLNELDPSGADMLLSYACCGTCDPERATPAPEPPTLEVQESCEPVYNTSYAGEQISQLPRERYESCCQDCSQHATCMAWTFQDSVCSLFSATSQTSLEVDGAVSGHNRCWASLSQTYARCCEDVGLSCHSRLPETCSDDCAGSVTSLLAHCDIDEYSQISLFFGRGNVGLFSAIRSICQHVPAPRTKPPMMPSHSHLLPDFTTIYHTFSLCSHAQRGLRLIARSR